MNLKKQIEQSKRPFVIAGPCSAETQEQVATIVADLSKLDVSLIRAGIWKPRTRPGSFEGLGEIALPWLVEASKLHQLPCSVEVANKDHVEKALKAGVDVLWIGARTTVNPFAVQEIADALRGTDIPVMIKNPVNPDLNLWIGAFERLAAAGLSDLTAIHRGFSFYDHPKYRNAPNWEIPIALKERMPDVPLICDPSHITGKRNLLLEISQKAMDLNVDGLMIETHPNPDQAWSDAEQQITAEGLRVLLSKLVLRSRNIGAEIADQMQVTREKIGVLDDRLFDILSARMLLSEEVGQFKKENNITILQPEHWAKSIQQRLNTSSDLKLSEGFIRQVMDAIHQESIRHQTNIMNRNEEND